MIRTNKYGLVLVLALSLLPRLTQAMEIVYPTDKAYFFRSDFLILRATGADSIVIGVNGNKSDRIDISAADYRAAFDDFVILEPTFDPGKNVVTVEGFAGEALISTVTADVFFQADPSSVPPRGYRPFVMHVPEKEVLCQPCHNMQPDKVQLGAETVDTNPCASCHRRMLDKPHVHGPAGVYQCVSCHDPDSKPERYRLKTSNAVLCNECHFDKVEEFNKNAFVHGPVGAGYCGVCHDSHASDEPGQLLKPVNQLCLGCHENVPKQIHVARGITRTGHPLEGPVDPSRPGKPLSCVSCHDPHGGMASSLFQRGITSRFGLCGICHQK